MRNVILAVYFLFLSSFAYAENTQLYRAKYKGEISGISISLTRTLYKTEAGSFELKTKASNIMGSIKEISRFNLINNVIQPTYYEQRKKSLVFSRTEKIDFDWATKKASYTNKQKPHRNAINPIFIGILDPASYQLQIQREVFFNKQDISITLVRKEKLKTRQFKFVKNSTLKIKNTNYKAVQITRINAEDNKTTNIWLIPELNYQIGKIQHIEEDGSKSELTLSTYEASDQLLNTIYNSKNNDIPSNSIPE